MYSIPPFKIYFQLFLAKSIFSLVKPLRLFLGLKKWTFIDKFKVEMNDGNSFWLFNNAFHLETRLFWEGFSESNWEKKTRELWISLCKNSIIIFDVGANTGIFSVLAKSYQPKAFVFAFEPQPNIFKILEKNKTINRLDINCFDLALSNIGGDLPFFNTGVNTFDSSNTTHGSLNKDWRTKDQHSIMVEAERLDIFLNRYEINGIDLIKIDVETLEFEVLQGYGEKLWLDRPIIILEIQNVEIGNNLHNMFKSNDYLYFWINENKGIFPVDELGRNLTKESVNFLLCPIEKENLIVDFKY